MQTFAERSQMADMVKMVVSDQDGGKILRIKVMIHEDLLQFA